MFVAAVYAEEILLEEETTADCMAATSKRSNTDTTVTTLPSLLPGRSKSSVGQQPPPASHVSRRSSSSISVYDRPGTNCIDDPSAVAIDLSWELPRRSKNFSKALKGTIQDRVNKCRASQNALEALDIQCRKIQRERWVTQQANASVARQRSNSPDLLVTFGPAYPQIMSSGVSNSSVNGPTKEFQAAQVRLRRFDQEVQHFVSVAHLDRSELVTEHQRTTSSTRCTTLASLISALPQIQPASVELSGQGKAARRTSPSIGDRRPDAAALRIAAREWSSHEIVAVIWLANVVKTTQTLSKESLVSTEDVAIAHSCSFALRGPDETSDPTRKSHLRFCWAHGPLPAGWQPLAHAGRLVASPNTSAHFKQWFRWNHSRRSIPLDGGSNDIVVSPRMMPGISVLSARGPLTGREKRNSVHAVDVAAADSKKFTEVKLGWKLLRAAVILRWACKQATFHVATTRVINVLRGARRMAKFHKAMHIFRRKLLICQRAARLHLRLHEAREATIRKAWSKGVSAYLRSLEKLWDPTGIVRKKIASEASVKRDFASFNSSPRENAVVTSPPTAAVVSFCLQDTECVSMDVGQTDDDIMLSDRREGVSNSPAGPFYLQHFSGENRNSFYFDGSSIIDGGFGSDDFVESGACLADDATAAWISARRRRPSTLASAQNWRPLEYRRKSQLQLQKAPSEIMTQPAAVAESIQKDVPESAAPVADPSFVGAEDVESEADILARTELLKELDRLQISEKRTENVLRRLNTFVHEINEVHAADFRARLGVYRFDLEAAEAKRGEYFKALRRVQQSLATHTQPAVKPQSVVTAQPPPLPKPPRPRLIVGVPSEGVLLAFAKSEVDEYLHRAAVANKASNGTCKISPLPRKLSSPIQSPGAVSVGGSSSGSKTPSIQAKVSQRVQQLLATVPKLNLQPLVALQLAAFHKMVKRIELRRLRLAEEQMEREEAAREVEPMPFPPVFRRDTIRSLVAVREGNV